jgi:hypothetical protein
MLAGPWGCSSSSSGSPADASVSDSAYGLGQDGSGTYGGSNCGGSMCPAVPAQAAAYVTACCTADGGCGGQTPLSSQCLPYGAVGGTDPTCPSFAAPTGITMQGCCRSDGQCGAYDGTLGLGCIANGSLNQPAKSCNYAANDCIAVTPLTCDGPEDCQGGQSCCGLYSGGGYTQFTCMPSCADAGTPDGGGLALWFEMCHAGQTCKDTTQSCLSSTYLPSSLYRCYTTGSPPPSTATGGPGVNCGATTCAAGEECCLREPHDPYCAPAGSACSCTGPADAGSSGDAALDGGAPADATSGDGAASPGDAAGE